MAGHGIVFGIHAAGRALGEHPGRVRALYVQQGRDDAPIQRLLAGAARYGVRVERVSRHRLDRLASRGRHQGVVLLLDTPPPLDERGLDALVAGLEEEPFLLALDGVQDPHNLGACLRSAEAAGVQAVIAPRDRAVALTPAARKAASGAAERLPFVQVTNLARVLRALAERRVWLLGADAGAPATLFETALTGPLCLVLGGEGQGLRRLTRECCDGLFSIPMRGGVESLNVSVAAGVCLFEALRQRSAADALAP